MMFKILIIFNFCFCIYSMYSLIRLVNKYEVDHSFNKFIVTAFCGVFCLFSYNLYSCSFPHGVWVYKISTSIWNAAVYFFIEGLKVGGHAKEKNKL